MGRLEQIRERRAARLQGGDVHAGDDEGWLLDQIARLRVEVAEAERALHAQPVLRPCVFPGCLREFDARATLAGLSPARESWSGKGWVEVRAVLGYACPEHAEFLRSAHTPTWRKGEDPEDPDAIGSWAACSCGWVSVKVRWRGYGIAAWRDHLLSAWGIRG